VYSLSPPPSLSTNHNHKGEHEECLVEYDKGVRFMVRMSMMMQLRVMIIKAIKEIITLDLGVYIIV
jgi:hypothetical protein